MAAETCDGVTVYNRQNTSMFTILFYCGNYYVNVYYPRRQERPSPGVLTLQYLVPTLTWEGKGEAHYGLSRRVSYRPRRAVSTVSNRSATRGLWARGRSKQRSAAFGCRDKRSCNFSRCVLAPYERRISLAVPLRRFQAPGLRRAADWGRRRHLVQTSNSCIT